MSMTYRKIGNSYALAAELLQSCPKQSISVKQYELQLQMN